MCVLLKNQFISSFGDDSNVTYIPLLKRSSSYILCVVSFFLFSVHYCSFWPPFLGSSATLRVRPLLLCSHSAEVFDKSWAGMTGGNVSGSRKLHAKTGAP